MVGLVFHSIQAATMAGGDLVDIDMVIVMDIIMGIDMGIIKAGETPSEIIVLRPNLFEDLELLPATIGRGLRPDQQIHIEPGIMVLEVPEYVQVQDRPKGQLLGTELALGQRNSLLFQGQQQDQLHDQQLAQDQLQMLAELGPPLSRIMYIRTVTAIFIGRIIQETGNKETRDPGRILEKPLVL